MENVPGLRRRRSARGPMTDEEQIRTYLRRVRSSLHVRREQRSRILEEIENHLQEGSAEYMRNSATRAQAIARVIEELGPPETVAAAFVDEGPPVPSRNGLLRWLPMLLPLSLLTVAVGLLAWSITWVAGDWTVGERVAQRAYLRSGVFAALLSYGAYFSIRRADRDRAWRWAAWACTGVALASLAIW